MLYRSDRVTLFLEDPDVRLFHGDALSVLAGLEDESVHMCVTSPPFYGLRDYGTGHWERPEWQGWENAHRENAIREADDWLGRSMTREEAEEIKAIYADPDCSWRGLAQAFGGRHGFDWAGNQIAGMDLWLAAQAYLREMWQEEADHEHDVVSARGGRGGSGAPGKNTEGAYPSEHPAAKCSCGAHRVDQQIGLEASPEEWVSRLVAVFREVRRVLRADGTLWLEVGDSYATGTTAKRNPTSTATHGNWENDAAFARVDAPGCKPKDLIGAPWMLAFALRADGWWLRSDIVWSRPNPMPESVTDRPTKSHSYIFLLSKSPRYFFDQEAVREPWESGRDDMRSKGVRTGLAYLQDAPIPSNHERTGERSPMDRGPTLDPSLPPEAPRGPDGRRATHVQGQDGSLQHRDGERWPNTGRNVRSVWTIPTQPYPEAHFATFPEELARRCISAGTSERGCCPECRAPWVREVERGRFLDGEPVTGAWAPPVRDGGSIRGEGPTGVGHWRLTTTSETTGWVKSCACAPGEWEQVAGTPYEGFVEAAAAPCVVLDPFVGSGTVPHVARKLGRLAIGIDLSADYLQLAARRLQQLSLLAGEATA